MTAQEHNLTIPINGKPHPLTFLQPHQILMIDEALASLGDFGEIHLVVEKSQLRFLVTQKSYDTLKWQPGALLTRGS